MALSNVKRCGFLLQSYANGNDYEIKEKSQVRTIYKILD